MHSNVCTPCPLQRTATILQCRRAFSPPGAVSNGGRGGGGAAAWSLECSALAALQGAHALSLFSVGALMGEGRLQCAIIDAAALMLAAPALAGLWRSHSASAAAAATASAAAAAAQQQQQQQRRSWLAVKIVAAAAAQIACNHALMRLGLIDRYGQDPHDKSEPGADLLGSPAEVTGYAGAAAARRRLSQLAAAAAPLALAWPLWALLARRLRRRWSSGSGGDFGSGAVAVLGAACSALQHAAIAAFWWARLSGRSGEPAVDILTRAAAAAAGWLGVPLASPEAAAAAAAAAAPWLRLPLRLLLPRAVYFLAAPSLAAAACAALARAAARRFGSSGGGAGLAPDAALWLAAAAAGPVVMVLGHKGPALALLALLQAVAVVALLALHREARAASAPEPAAKRRRAGDGASSAEGDDRAPLTALLFGMHCLQLFFCSGHFCEFSGLQYASSFIGFDEMRPLASGPLLLLNTFGPQIVLCLALPAALAAGGVGGGGGGDGSGAGAAVAAEATAGGRVTRARAAAAVATEADAEDARQLRRRRLLTGAVLLVSGGRAAALAVCIASAAVQQGHILLWAIFAPKLIFEMWLCAVADAALLLAALLCG